MLDEITDIRPATVRTAAPDDLAAASAVLAAAFHDDPVFAHCVPDPEQRRRVLPAFFRLVADVVAPADDVHVAAEAGAPVAGTALWLPPGVPAVPASQADAFEAGLGELLGADAERTFGVVALLEEHHPHEDHHYLWFLAVAPQHQGRGLGSALLAGVLHRADAHGVPAYLEATSPRNRRLYERHGFVVVDELVVPDGPTLWAMWRSPQPASRFV